MTPLGFECAVDCLHIAAGDDYVVANTIKLSIVQPKRDVWNIATQHLWGILLLVWEAYEYLTNTR